MNKRNERSWKVIGRLISLTGVLLLAACGSRARIGELQSESQSVELGEAEEVRVEILFGAGELQVSGGAEELLQADFSYNVAVLKPEVEYENGTLTVRQPDTNGLPVFRDLSDFRNEWDLRLNDSVPVEMRVEVGAGKTDMQLASLNLTGLDVSLGAGETTIDLSGDWTHDLDVTIEAGAGDITVRVPSQVGVRVKVQAGIGSIVAPGFSKDGDTYTNATFGDSDVTLNIDIEAGIGQITIEVAESSSLTKGFNLGLVAN